MPKKKAAGRFTEDRAVWRDELQRHCEDLCDNQEKTAETQRERIMTFKAEGDKHFTEDGRIAESTLDLVLPSQGQDGGRKRRWT